LKKREIETKTMNEFQGEKIRKKEKRKKEE